MMGKTVLIRGVGDVGSAVAHVLFHSGHRVVVHDVPAPTYSRRGMAFLDAIFDGPVVLSGIVGKFARDTEAIACMLDCRKAIPVTTHAFDRVLDATKPDALVDARMMKRAIPEPQMTLAPLTVGLGPNFIAGETTHVAVETAWGDSLGAVVRDGPTRVFEGEPRILAGVGRTRFIYAPTAGLFTSDFEIGQVEVEGVAIAHLDQLVLRAPLSGIVRGLTHSGVRVPEGAKIVEIDPRPRNEAQVFGLSERPLRIAEGVLKVITSRSGP